MSLNFGFSLPALLKYGIGGFDPFNQSGPTLDLVFAGTASEMLSGGYTLDTNFIVPQYEVAAQYSVWENGVGMAPKTFSDIVTFTRASSATLFDSTGTLVFAPMNAIRNNTMVGAVAGTPGTLPTNWFTVTALTGLTQTVVGTGTENGVTYIDIRINGTPSGAGTFGIYFEGNLAIAALNGQIWTESVYLKLQAGTLNGVTDARLAVDERSSTAYIRSNVSGAITPTTAALNTQRNSLTATLSGGATVANIVPYVNLNLTVAAIDITLRIGMPQLELGSVATAVNATSGTAYQGPRFDYDPSTLVARGLLIEEQRTNSIRNNTMQGAVAGTPGTLPTNWVVSGLGTLTQQVVGTGTVNGITYIDLRFSGTTSTTQMSVRFEPSNVVAATNGQTWTGSSWCAVTAGSLTNITGNGFNANIYDAASVYLTSIFLGGINTTSTLTRTTHSGTIASATAAFIQPQIYLLFSSGVAIDITLRIGLPQLELGAFATSVIPTTTTATTRSADVASVNTLSPWFNAAEGTLFADLVNITRKAAVDYPRLVALVGSDANNNEISIYTRTQGFGTGMGYGSVTAGGTNTFDPGNPATTVDAWKAAIAYKTNDTAFACSGLVTATDTSVTLPTCVQLRLFGQARFQLMPSGYLRRITYYPRRMPNAQLQTITT